MTDELRRQLREALGTSYTITREIGDHFAARASGANTDVLLRVVSPSLPLGERASEVAAALRAANAPHPNLEPVLDAGVADNLVWYTEPLTTRETLRARVRRESSISIRQALELLRDVARGLAEGHARGMVHGRLTPECILVDNDGASVREMAMGRALQLAAPPGQLGPTLRESARGGKRGFYEASYRAPEVGTAGRAPEARGDVYAWGVIAYELLAGAHPFSSHTSAETMAAAHASEAPPPLLSRSDDGTASLPQLVMQALEKDADRRPASAAALVTALDAIEIPALEDPSSPARRQRRRLQLAVLIVFFVMVAAVGGWGIVAALAAARRPVAQPQPSTQEKSQ